MEKTLLLSVIMPVHNGSSYLVDSIKSVLIQNYSNFELIIINDGSTDNSEKIIKEFNDERIKLISNKKKSGIVYSLNKGLNISRGKFIARMDSDDICTKNRFMSQVNFLLKNQEIGLCSGHILKIDSSGKVLSKVNFPISDKDCNMHFLFGNPIVHPAAMFKKDLALEVGGYSIGSEPAEDLDLWLKISSKSKIANLNKVLLHYRIHEQNYSSVKYNIYFEKLDLVYNNFEKINKFIPPTCKDIYIWTVMGNWNKKTNSVVLKKLFFLKKHILTMNKNLSYYDNHKLSSFINNKFSNILLAVIKSNKNSLFVRGFSVFLLFKFDLRNTLNILKTKHL